MGVREKECLSLLRVSHYSLLDDGCQLCPQVITVKPLLPERVCSPIYIVPVTQGVWEGRERRGEV